MRRTGSGLRSGGWKAPVVVLAAYYGTAVVERVLPRPWLRRFRGATKGGHPE